MENNPDDAYMYVYDIPVTVRDALAVSRNSEKIEARFRNSGIYPLNRYIFNDDEYLVGYVTVRVSGLFNLAYEESDDLVK